VKHADILDAAVIGVPDEKWGERLKAFVVRKSGSALTPEAIIAYCDGRISSMKIPKDFAFIDVLPRNASGKVLKTSLRQLP
jgi:acyl-CoA synthetase (AMP-forming)/AMP-acid ligase II